MTMFRKVFSSRLSESVDDQGQPVAGDRRTALPFESAADLTRALRQTDQDDAAPEATRVTTTPVTRNAPVLPDDEPVAEPTSDLAQRAQEAQRQMRVPQPAEQPGSTVKLPPHTAEDIAEAAPRATPQITPDQPASAPRRPAGRARTRLLGFDAGAETANDPFGQPVTDASQAPRTHPTGWIVIVDGPGQGHSFAVYSGVAMVGRGEDQHIRLDFGDMAISRQNHAAVAYDAEENRFYLGHGGKSNIMRLNDRPVLSTEDLAHGDTIRIGETTLRFVALCGAGFHWGGGNNA